QTFVQNTLDQSHTQAASTLTVSQSALFHYVLSADTGTATAAAAVRMTIFDAGGRVVFTLVAGNREPVSSNVFLTQGTYTVRFAAATQNGQPLPALVYTVRGQKLSDPVGP